MGWPALGVAGSRLFSPERAYLHARLGASRLHTPQPASWWGLCALLSQHQMRHGRISPMPELWAELLPFLLIADERTAEQAVETYLVYLDDPPRVDLQWLGLRVNDAMSRVERWNDHLAVLLEEPASAFDAHWMALLSYESLQRLRRAVVLYGDDRARMLRRSCWHGMPAYDEQPARHGARTVRLHPARGPLVRSRIRPAGLYPPATSRRFRPSVPLGLS